MELRLLLSCSWLHWVPRLLPHTQASPGQGWRGWREGGRPTDTVSSPQPVPFTGRIEGGLQDGHKVTVMGRVLSTDENRYGGLLSLSASALSEPGCCQLRGSTQLPPSCPHPVQGMARARPANNAQAPYHLPVASGAPLTRLPRDRGNGGSWSREGSRPAQRWSLGLNFVYNDPELEP